MPLPPRAVAAVLAAGGVAFLALQCVRPALEDRPAGADLDAPAPVKAILRNSCYACHSTETRLPWFDQVVPAYWLVVHDVREGREHLNFSEIGALPEAKRKGLLWEAVNHAMLGAMPPGRYTLIHPHAKVTPEQLAVLKEWLHPAAPAPAPTLTPAPIVPGVADAALPPVPEAVPAAPPAPNGMAFPSDFREWRPISTTDRFDNRTLRMILGNDVARKAVAEGRVRPWPDGAAFAKIAYAPSADGRAATYKQVEFMVKDAKGHAATEGWAYGRWVGNELKPYGKDKDFARECAGCHAPMKENDYVYSLPLKDGPADAARFNAEGALPTGLGLPADLLSWQPLASSVDEAAGTMTTLYANGPALAAGRAGRLYPAGAVLARVTWARRDDPHWFGARIPGAVREVETLAVREDLSRPTASLRPAFAYARYAGAPLAKEPDPDLATVQARALALLAEKASPLP